LALALQLALQAPFSCCLSWRPPWSSRERQRWTRPAAAARSAS